MGCHCLCRAVANYDGIQMKDFATAYGKGDIGVGLTAIQIQLQNIHTR